MQVTQGYQTECWKFYQIILKNAVKRIPVGIFPFLTVGRFPIKTVGNMPQCRNQKNIVSSFPNSYFLSMNLVVLDLTIQETLYDSFATFLLGSTVQPGIANSARLKQRHLWERYKSGNNSKFDSRRVLKEIFWHFILTNPRWT